MLKLKINQDDIKDYLEWIKLLITICSGAIAGIVIKFADVSTNASNNNLSVKISGFFFIIAIIFLIISYTVLIEHKTSSYNEVKKLGTWAIIIGYGCFIFAFTFLLFTLFP